MPTNIYEMATAPTAFGFESVAVGNSDVEYLTVPARAERARITNDGGQGVYYRVEPETGETDADNCPETTGKGHYLAANAEVLVDGRAQVVQFRAICDNVGGTTLAVTYYK